MSEQSAQPMVSVIIVSWNACEYLRQCLASLTTDVCRFPMEIIVVDNASSDGSPDVVAKEFPHVRLIRASGNLGFAKGNNVGVAAAKGRYLALVNSDVKVLPNCLTRLIEYCEAHPEVGMAGPHVIGGDGKLQRSCRGFPTVWNMFCRALALDTIFPKNKLFTGFSLSHWEHDESRAVDILSGCFWLVRKNALSKVGLLDESFFMYGEVLDWCRRFWKNGWKVMYLPTADAIHFGGASSSNAPLRFFIERQRADLQYWAKHHSRLGVACFFVISCLQLVLRMIGYAIAFAIKSGKRENYRYKINRSLACLKWMCTGCGPVPKTS
jgi:GT2 family glycosyltransferase